MRGIIIGTLFFTTVMGREETPGAPQPNPPVPRNVPGAAQMPPVQDGYHYRNLAGYGWLRARIQTMEDPRMYLGYSAWAWLRYWNRFTNAAWATWSTSKWIYDATLGTYRQYSWSAWYDYYESWTSQDWLTWVDDFLSTRSPGATQV